MHYVRRQHVDDIAAGMYGFYDSWFGGGFDDGPWGSNPVSQRALGKLDQTMNVGA